MGQMVELRNQRSTISIKEDARPGFQHILFTRRRDEVSLSTVIDDVYHAVGKQTETIRVEIANKVNIIIQIVKNTRTGFETTKDTFTKSKKLIAQMKFVNNLGVNKEFARFNVYRSIWVQPSSPH